MFVLLYLITKHASLQMDLILGTLLLLQLGN